MKEYLISYFGEPQFHSKEEGQEHMTKWRDWMGGIMESVVNPGVPVHRGKKVTLDGISDQEANGRLTGYTIVKAENLTEATTLITGCPHLDHGHVEVCEVMDMAMM